MKLPAWVRQIFPTVPEKARWCGCIGYSTPMVEMLMHETRSVTDAGLHRIDICHRSRRWRKIPYSQVIGSHL